MPDNIPSLKLSSNIEAASQVYELKIDNPLDKKNIGFATDILNILSLELRDQLITEQFNEEFIKIHQDILDSIQNPFTGYLLEIVVYVDSEGFLKFPQGRIINPIGIGYEPLDAMSNYLNTDRMVPGGLPPKNLKSNSSFLWITKSEGKISAKSIDKLFYNDFMKMANDEAKKRKLMGQWISMNSAKDLKEIKVAEFWIEQEKQKLALFEDEMVKQKVQKLTNEMKELQNKTNELYKEYQVTQEEIVKNQKLLNTLHTISTVAGIVKTGIEMNKALSKNNKSVGNISDNHLLSLEETTTLTNSKLTGLGMQNNSLSSKMIEYLDDMGTLHKELTIIYGITVEPIPTFEDNPLLKP